MKKLINKWFLIMAFCISLIAGCMFYHLMSKPFGMFFNASFYLLTASLVVGFLILGFMCFYASKRWLKFIGILPLLLSTVIFLIAAIVSIDIRILYFAGIPPVPTKEEWVKDLHYFADQMKEKYPDIYSKVSREVFTKTINDIETRIPELSESDIVMEFFRLSALPNDAHSIPFIFSPCFDLHDFPIKIYHFKDGWYIIDAASTYSNLVGSKILKVGSTSVDELFQKFKPYLSAENEYAQLERFTYIGLMPEWLKSQGIINNLKSVQFTVVKENCEIIVETLKPTIFPLKFYWTFLSPVDNRTASAILNPRKDWYWFEYLESSKTIYFQFNKVENQSGKETIAEFTKRLEGFVNTNDFDRFVVDIRNNMGGDDIYLKPLVELIRDNPKINVHHKLFVLIGRHSFSSAVLFANKLKFQTKALFIGEPTAQGPVFGGNPTHVTLPYSKLIFTIATTSTAQTQTEWPFQLGSAIIPDTLVEDNFADFKAGNDPVMELALKYKTDVPKSKILPETFSENYIGRYLLSQLQILEVKRNGKNLSFTIDDFTDYNLFRVQSDLYAKSENEFETDFKDVSVLFPYKSAEGISLLTLNWKGETRVLKRAPKNYLTVLELFAQKRIEEAVNEIELNKEEYRKLLVIEHTLNMTGYEYLKQDKVDAAIKIFMLNVDLFPNSSNTYDSLGEAYMKNGQKELAINNYEKSLELNPQNQNAIDKLKQLKENK